MYVYIYTYVYIYIYIYTYIYTDHILDINIGIPKMYDVFVDESPIFLLILLSLAVPSPKRPGAKDSQEPQKTSGASAGLVSSGTVEGRLRTKSCTS